VLFGLLVIIWPGQSLVALVLIFGVFALVDGVVLAFSAYRAGQGNRVALGIQAGLAILVGLLALLWPLALGIALVFLIGAWAIITGVAEIITAVRLRARISSEWLLIFVGALSIIFGLLLWFWPGLGALGLITVVGVYALVYGVVMAVAGFRLRGAAGAGEQPAGHAGQTAAEAGERPVNPFDEGYAGGYSAGYRGDQRETGRPGADEDETASPGGGRHRTHRENPDDPGNR
jgi:uncharacterized membrane protein HdeD (DUF308 family)